MMTMGDRGFGLVRLKFDSNLHPIVHKICIVDLFKLDSSHKLWLIQV